LYEYSNQWNNVNQPPVTILQRPTWQPGRVSACRITAAACPHRAGRDRQERHMAELYAMNLTDEAPASTPEPPRPPGEDRDRKHPPEPDDDAPETPPTDPAPVPVQDPPAEPGSRGPYVV
jgi:hypothetical protein